MDYNTIKKLVTKYQIPVYDDVINSSIQYVNHNYFLNTKDEKILICFVLISNYLKSTNIYKSNLVDIDSILGMDLPKFRKKINPEIYVKKIYINLNFNDAVEKNKNSMKWDFSEEFNKRDVKNIISIKINNFKFNQMITSNFAKHYYTYERKTQGNEKYNNVIKYVTIGIEELIGNSFIWQNRKCHFIGMWHIIDWVVHNQPTNWFGYEWPPDSTPSEDDDLINEDPEYKGYGDLRFLNNPMVSFDGVNDEHVYSHFLNDGTNLFLNKRLDNIYKMPLMNNGEYHFNTPISELNTITLSFGLNEVLYDIDYEYYNKVIYNANALYEYQQNYYGLPLFGSPEEPIIDLEITYLSDQHVFEGYT